MYGGGYGNEARLKILAGKTDRVSAVTWRPEETREMGTISEGKC